jgi:hypothetical protein
MRHVGLPGLAPSPGLASFAGLGLASFAGLGLAFGSGACAYFRFGACAYFRFDLTWGPYDDCKPTTPAGQWWGWCPPIALPCRALVACRRSQLKTAATPGKIEPPLAFGIDPPLGVLLLGVLLLGVLLLGFLRSGSSARGSPWGSLPCVALDALDSSNATWGPVFYGVTAMFVRPVTALVTVFEL